jgi:lactate dehydrogenase-like 2-hydroxyacid dehydrogenase
MQSAGARDDTERPVALLGLGDMHAQLDQMTIRVDEMWGLVCGRDLHPLQYIRRRCDFGSSVKLTIFNHWLGEPANVVKALAEFEIVVLMRERTPFPRSVIEALPKLRLLVTTGMRNAAIDLNPAYDNDVLVCGTELAPHPTAELVFAHLLEFTRKVGFQNCRLKSGVAWRRTKLVKPTPKSVKP